MLLSPVVLHELVGPGGFDDLGMCPHLSHMGFDIQAGGTIHGVQVGDEQAPSFDPEKPTGTQANTVGVPSRSSLGRVTCSHGEGRAARNGTMNTSSVAPFIAASRFFVDCVAAVPADQYDAAWSDEWHVLDLIGHGNRANVLPVEYYERPVPRAGPDYILPENIAERGRQAVRELGDDPVAAVRAASQRASAVVAAAPDDAIVGTPFGEQALDAYLRSRTAELVLHGIDLGTDVGPPPEALMECGVFLVERAVRSDRGLEVVRALSGRGPLAAGFNVY